MSSTFCGLFLGLYLFYFPESLFFHEAISWRAFIGAVSSGSVERISFKISSSSGKRDRPFAAGLEVAFSSEVMAVQPKLPVSWPVRSF